MQHHRKGLSHLGPLYVRHSVAKRVQELMSRLIKMSREHIQPNVINAKPTQELKVVAPSRFSAGNHVEGWSHEGV